MIVGRRKEGQTEVSSMIPDALLSFSGWRFGGKIRMPEWVAVQLGSCFSGLAQTRPIKATSGPRKGNVFVLGIQSGVGEVNSALPEAFCWRAAKLYCTYLKVREKQKQDYIFLFSLMYILLMSFYNPTHPPTHTKKSENR